MKSLSYKVNNQESNINRLDYIVATLFLACGGNQVLTENAWYVILVTIVMLFITAKSTRNFSDGNLIRWELAFLTLAGLQVFTLQSVSLPAYVNFSLKLLAGFLMVNFLGYKFRMAYLRVIVYFSTISLVLWLLYSIINPFIHLSIGIPVGYQCRSFLIWAYFEGETVPRNQGMFWEPGAFQGYLMLVPILFIGDLRELWKRERKSCLILLAALLSTTSTTGYVAFMFIVASYVLRSGGNIFAKSIMVLVFAAVSIYAISTLDFLGNKITSQYEKSQNMAGDDHDVMMTRVGTMLIDSEIIEKHPLIGNGFDIESKYGIYSEVMKNSGNGLTGVVCTLGIPFFLLYLLAVSKRLMAKSYFKVVAIITILLVYYGENFYNFIPYWSLIFVRINSDDLKSLTKMRKNFV